MPPKNYKDKDLFESDIMKAEKKFAKPKKALTPYNKYFATERRAGRTPKEIGENWKTSSDNPKSSNFTVA